MRVTFLGTSSGAPTRSRNVSAPAVQRGSAWDLFDCGEVLHLAADLDIYELGAITEAVQKRPGPAV